AASSPGRTQRCCCKPAIQGEARLARIFLSAAQPQPTPSPPSDGGEGWGEDVLIFGVPPLLGPLPTPASRGEENCLAFCEDVSKRKEVHREWYTRFTLESPSPLIPLPIPRNRLPQERMGRGRGEGDNIHASKHPFAILNCA